MRKALVLTLSLIVGLLGASPAVAEPEPDDWIWQASGPVMSGSITGTIASYNDYDYYMFYAASQTQLVVTLQPWASCDFNRMVTLKDSDGVTITDAYFGSGPRTIKYTTPVGTNRFFLLVYGTSGCGSTYNISLSPTSALLAGPAMPSATLATGEPNESAAQPQGPLSADVIYTGQIETRNDEDWFTFYASAAFSLEGTIGSGCDIDFSPKLVLRDADQDSVDYFSVLSGRYRRISYSPPGWKQYFIQVIGGQGCGYRFSLSPASAIQSGPAPTPVAPAPMSGLTYRKTKKTVVVYWSAISGATGYQVRVRKNSTWGAWKSTANTWMSYKRSRLPKTVKVQARAINGAGAGAAQTIKVRVRR